MLYFAGIVDRGLQVPGYGFAGVWSSVSDCLMEIDGLNNCRRCIVINERHHNVLQYKESLDCEETKASLDTLCMESIPGDAQLYSLFRLDSAPVDCPFKGAPFTFTYNRGHGECRNPVSHVDSCTDNTRLLFRFQACPDVQKTESTAEEMQCYATWKEGSQHYLIGRMQNHLSSSGLEDTYRCFVYEKIGGKHGQAVEYKIAQSGDATCTGVQSPTDGARTMVLTKAEPPSAKCKFPAWFSSSHWYTLDGKMLVKANHKNGSVHVSGDKKMIMEAIGYPTRGHQHGDSSSSKSFITGGSRISCQSIKEFSDSHVSVVAHHLDGCKSKTVCMHMYRRDRHVIEIQTKEVTGAEEFDCGNRQAMSGNSAQPYVTLISTEAQHRRCPHVGKYLATGITQDGRVVRDTCNSLGFQGGNFNTLIVGCGEKATMEFVSNCPEPDDPAIFACHGNWEEDGSGYVIATNVKKAGRRYCFVYRSSPTGGLTVYSANDACHRPDHVGARGSPWAFNLTIEAKCAEELTAGAVRLESMTVIPTLCGVALLLFVQVAWLVTGSDAQSSRGTSLRHQR